MLFGCIAATLQGNPQRMRLQRRLYGFYTVCFLISMIPSATGNLFPYFQHHVKNHKTIFFKAEP